MTKESKILEGLTIFENSIYEYCSLNEFHRNLRFETIEFNTDKLNNKIEENNTLINLLNDENFDELMKAMCEYHYVKIYIKNKNGELYRCYFNSYLVPESTKFDRSEVSWIVESIPDSFPDYPNNYVCGFTMFREKKINF